MNTAELQTLIGANPVDGLWGPNSQTCLEAHFVNLDAPAITDEQIAEIAASLGVSEKQVCAVAEVESAGGGFDTKGKPKILYERHYFHRLTGGKWSTCSYSNSKGGGYDQPSWPKLGSACGKNPDAAFASCSWGKFQVMGDYWDEFAFASSYAMAHSCSESEYNHYVLLAKFVASQKIHGQSDGLKNEMKALSTDPEDCRAFAKGYNGSGYEQNAYHEKLAAAMR